ncbi:hypothetical protein [Brucella grignonensis]|uniref:Uncharacterized protein n=1 Tax=Brucella grignonensis TaxID=94627 RepID=A0A256EZG2_9HYPH|nr:hypothetical protein [Brucella grignonensis]OYR07836.1 hypothetical protein CEV33_3587 [Brucella grignonensis]
MAVFSRVAYIFTGAIGNGLYSLFETVLYIWSDRHQWPFALARYGGGAL